MVDLEGYVILVVQTFNGKIRLYGELLSLQGLCVLHMFHYMLVINYMRKINLLTAYSDALHCNVSDTMYNKVNYMLSMPYC